MKSTPLLCAEPSGNGGPRWPTRELRPQQYANDRTLYFRGLLSRPRLIELLHYFGRATNLHINEPKTVGIYYGLDHSI